MNKNIEPVASASSRLDPSQLGPVVEMTLEEATQRGASAAEAVASLSQGLAVNVRMGEIETVEHTRDRGLVVTVYFEQRTGSASTSDYSLTSVKDTVQAACRIAEYTEADSCNGLADPDRLATNFPNLDLFHPWDPSVAFFAKLY